MASKLQPDEAGTRGVRRIARRRIRAALDTLAPKHPDAAAVHEARKELKKARAALRLLRDALGRRTYKKENAALRDAARPLSTARDGQVLLDALQSLLEHSGRAARALPLTRLTQNLNAGRARALHEILDEVGPLRGARKTLRKVHSRSRHWPVGHHGWSVLGAGLERTYTRGREAFKLARAKPTDVNLHEWRKQTKYLWSQLQVLRPLQGEPLDAMAQRAHELAEVLGDDHDLAVLHERATRDAFPNTRGHRAFLTLIARHRAKLQARAMQLGVRLYAEKPRTFTAGIGRYWKDWHHG